MHVLITSDTVGGVWTYTQELVSGLVQAGHRVTLVSFGQLPGAHQTAWIDALGTIDYRPTEYRLEWMEVAENDIEESRRYLELVVEEVRPDVLHLSQYSYGDISVDVPRIVVAHSDVVSWWMAVHGQEPDDTPWMRTYRERVSRGLGGADLVVAPSGWMLNAVCRHYLEPRNCGIIYNGRTAALLDPTLEKEDLVLTVGRIWDAGKQVSLLAERPLPGRVVIVGCDREPGREGRRILPDLRANVERLSSRSEPELCGLYARAAIYVATSRYEPFGLAPLEAAFSRCALVLNDNPVFHELWGDAAVYFARNDADDLASMVARLLGDPAMRREYAERAYRRARQGFTAERMVAEYEAAYQLISSGARVA
ncbi:MAG: glycosyltransferase family 4 protein [Acidobacteria bacterium]|nr:glycosyltransferase family 4 protein [Acidobacteriota bacterium]MBV9622377.1 glycosyltransferase family 4 protein [Acidobacteriota bacterium]